MLAAVLASSSTYAGYGGPGAQLPQTGGHPLSIALIGLALVLVGLVVVLLRGHFYGGR